MGLFRKKKQEIVNDESITVLKKESDSKNISKNLFRIYLKEKVGNTEATFATFEGRRWFEEDSEIPYIRNDKLGFLEVVPEQEKDYLNLDKDKIEKDIEEIKVILGEIKDLSTPAEIMETYGNPKNYEYKLIMAEAKLRALKYDTRSYMTFGQNGEKEYTFIRDGSHYIPRAVDCETYTAFYPPDSKKKTFAFTHRNKQSKHGMGQKIMSAALAAAWIFGIVFLMGTGYLYMQSYKSYTESEVIKARTFCLDTGVTVVGNLERQSNAITKIYEEVASKIEKPTIVIDGVQPK